MEYLWKQEKSYKRIVYVWYYFFWCIEFRRNTILEVWIFFATWFPIQMMLFTVDSKAVNTFFVQSNKNVISCCIYSLRYCEINSTLIETKNKYTKQTVIWKLVIFCSLFADDNTIPASSVYFSIRNNCPLKIFTGESNKYFMHIFFFVGS